MGSGRHCPRVEISIPVLRKTVIASGGPLAFGTTASLAVTCAMVAASRVDWMDSIETDRSTHRIERGKVQR